MRLFTRFLLAAMLFVAYNYTYAQQTAATNNNSDAVNRQVSNFNSIRIQGAFDVYVTQGPTEELRMEGANDLVSQVITEVKGGELNVRNTHQEWWQNINNVWHGGDWWNEHRRITVYLTVKNLQEIKISGSVRMNFKDGINADAMKLFVRGSGKIDGRISANMLQSHISGSGNINLLGKAENSTVRIAGSGHFSGLELVTANSKVHVSGSGSADVNAAATVDASVRGSASVSYKGNAVVVISSRSGSGAIKRI